MAKASRTVAYDLKGQIHKTLQGQIVEATESRSGQSVALKISYERHIKQCAENPEMEWTLYKHLYRDEAKIPHLIGYYGGFRTQIKKQNCICLVLEYVKGQDLLEFLLKHPLGLTEDLARSIILKIAQALKELHERKVVHLDLSPENVLIGDDGSVKLCDLGQGAFGPYVMNGPDAKKSKVIRQKSSYRAPEVADDEAWRYDGTKVDVWGLGVILWTLLTLSPPYGRPYDSAWYWLLGGRAALLHYFKSCTKREPSASLLDLFCSIFVRSPGARISLHHVLSHPWLAESDGQSTSNKKET